MKVRDLMRKNPKTVSLDCPLDDIWHLLSQKMLHILPVVNEEGQMRGIITAEDILKNLMPDYREIFSQYYPSSPTIDDIEDQIEKQVMLIAKDIMNKKIYSVHDDQDVYRALSRMLAYKVRILPVLDRKEKLVGFIVEKDIFRYLFEKEKHLLAKLKKMKK